MGLASLPSPSEGMLTVVLVNTALSVSILKQLLRSAIATLHSYSPIPSAEPTDGDCLDRPTTADRFRTVRFDRRAWQDDCRVCLCRFEPESVVSRLPCGHLFHRSCVETWIDYQNATCPLCRTQLLSEEPEPEPVGSRSDWF